MEDSRRDLKDDDLNSLVPDVQVDRRGFVAACIAAGFAVTAEPLLAQAIKTSMDGLEGGDIKIGEIPAYYAVPKGKGRRPVILVVAEVWGNHEHIKDVVRRVAKAGYFAVSNEPYFRIGSCGSSPTSRRCSPAPTSSPTNRRSPISTPS
jgi:carboxymethylenebutenolidase